MRSESNVGVLSKRLSKLQTGVVKHGVLCSCARFGGTRSERVTSQGLGETAKVGWEAAVPARIWAGNDRQMWGV